MVEFAVVKRACLAFICAAAAQYGKTVWFGWVWEYWSWVKEPGGAVGSQLLEYLLSLRWCGVVDEVTLVALLLISAMIGTRNTVVGWVEIA